MSVIKGKISDHFLIQHLHLTIIIYGKREVSQLKLYKCILSLHLSRDTVIMSFLSIMHNEEYNDETDMDSELEIVACLYGHNKGFL